MNKFYPENGCYNAPTTFSTRVSFYNSEKYRQSMKYDQAVFYLYINLKLT